MALADNLKKEALGGRVTSVEFYKKERAFYLIIKKDKGRLALGLRYHPAGFGLFLVPASKIKIETREKPRSLYGLEGSVLSSVEQVGFDRIIRLGFESEKNRSTLIIEALGPNGNIRHLDSSDGILADLRRKSFHAGEKYQPPQPPDKIDPRTVTPEILARLIDTHPDISPETVPARQLHGFNRTLAAEIFARAGIKAPDPGSMNRADYERLAKQVREIVGRFDASAAGYLYDSPDGVEVYPFRLKCAEREAVKFKTLSLAVLAMTDMKRSGSKEADEQKQVNRAVDRQVKKLIRQLSKVEEDLSRASGYEQYKKHGELLQINFDKLRTGLEEITVDDIYSDSPKRITIRLDPALTPNQNVESYFKKYRKGRDGVELLKRRLDNTREELRHIEQIQAALKADFETARHQYEQEIRAVMPVTGGGPSGTTVRLPYREYRLSTGLRLLVGRDGADNDRTTFDHARPYELWFHTQQCPGSHVILKFPGKSFDPSKAEIEEAASIAAYHSKARNDSLVPVVYTKRKYVHKPRKAKPGLVTVQREKSIMVQPRAPQPD